jgi:predicted DNA-binding transcriptional regulator AlpA
MGRGPNSERREVLRRFFALAEADQLLVYTEIRADLGSLAGPKTELDRQLEERARALEALARVATHLRKRGQLADDRAPTSRQFQAVARQLEPQWNPSRVIRAFGSWRSAQGALLGGSVGRRPSQARARVDAGGRARIRREPLEALESWLRTNPLDHGRGNYENWAREENAKGSDAVPFPGPLAITAGLGLSWPRAVAVAEGKLTLDAARAAQAEEVLGDLGDDDLTGSEGVALLLGIPISALPRTTGRSDFPKPVAKLGRVRAWLVGDVRAFARAETVPKRQVQEWQARVVLSRELAEILGLELASMHALIHERNWHLVPEPDGRVGNLHYWWKATVENWRRDNKVRRRRPAA